MSLPALVLTAAVTQNVVLVRFLAPWPYPAYLTSPRRAAGFSGALAAILTWSATVYAAIERTVLDPLGLGSLETISLAAVLMLTLLAALRLTIAIAPSHYARFRAVAPLVVVNAAVFVVAATLPGRVDRFVQIPVVALAAGAGVFLALVPLSAIRYRLDRSRLPRALRGDAAVYLATALTAIVIERIDEFVGAAHTPLW